MQIASSLRRIILSSVACLALPYFLNELINGSIFRKNLLKINMCFDFIYKLVWKFSQYKKNSAKYYHNFTSLFIWCIRYFSQILIKLEMPWQIFEKFSNISFHEYLSSLSRIDPCGEMDGWKDRRTNGRPNRNKEINSCFSQFFERAYQKWITLCSEL